MRLMRLIRLEAIYPKQKTITPNLAHRIYPYLIQKLCIDYPNQVWASDIDNIFIEWWWWTLKYHYFYLRIFENGSKLRNGIKNWFQYYNQERFHQSL
jgi:hypothetical protein